MSTHAHPQSRHASTTEPTADADTDTEETGGPDQFDTHNAAATFGASDARLPNTVDRENKHVG